MFILYDILIVYQYVLVTIGIHIMSSHVDSKGEFLHNFCSR